MLRDCIIGDKIYLRKIVADLPCCPWFSPQISGRASNSWVELTVLTLLGDPVLTLAKNMSLHAWLASASVVMDGGAISNDSKSRRKSHTAKV